MPKILALHKVQSTFSWGATNYSPRRLRRLLAVLQANGYRFATLQEVIQTGDEKLVAITFDDAYAHLVEALPPLIKQFEIRPHIFVPTAWIGLTNAWDYSHSIQMVRHLDKTGISQLADAGATFGSHGHSHVSLPGLTAEALHEELEASKTILEDVTGERVDTIAYPFGRASARVTQQANDAGYTYGFSIRLPRADDNRLAIGRIPVYGFDSPLSVLRRLRGGPWRTIERAKVAAVNSLAGGTVMLQRFRRS